MARISKFEDIESWKRARVFANEVYKITATGEFARDFGLKDQIRRAASRSCQTSQRVSNVAVTMNLYNSFPSPKGHAVKLARSFTLRSTKLTFRRRNLNSYHSRPQNSAS